MKLVLGTPDPVATFVVELLLSEGEEVVVLGALGDERKESAQFRSLLGDPASIDFGLGREEYAWLLREVESVYVAVSETEASEDLERSRAVRTAAEVSEFVKAGGAPGGVRFLSSLLVLGNASGSVSEDDFYLSQGFLDSHEESLAIAEKIIRALDGMRPLAIVRVGVLIGAERTGTLLDTSPLWQLHRSLSSESQTTAVFSDQPVRLESVERAGRALLRLTPRVPSATYHLVDDMPLTDRQLVQFMAKRVGARVTEAQGGARALLSLTRTRLGGSRALRGWGLVIGRLRAEAELGDLLDRDEEAFFSAFFPEPKGATGKGGA